MSTSSAAVDRFRKGCACSQAVLSVYSARFGLDEDTALRLASGFAGGMRRAATCGAVTGGNMVLGLAHAGEDCETMAGRQTVYAAVRSLGDRFRDRNGSLDCRDLLGCDVSTPEGHQRAVEQHLFVTRCPAFVRDAVEIVAELLPDAP